jgi:hypothetical protein
MRSKLAHTMANMTQDAFTISPECSKWIDTQIAPFTDKSRHIGERMLLIKNQLSLGESDLAAMLKRGPEPPDANRCVKAYVSALRKAEEELRAEGLSSGNRHP